MIVDQPARDKPLTGVRVLVTRPEDPADRLKARFAELGAEVTVQPAIQISDPPDWGPVDAVLARPSEYDWVVFSSVHGVRWLLGRARQLRVPDALRGPRVAAIGPGTANEARRWGLSVELVPDSFRAEDLAERLISCCRKDEGAASEGPEPLRQRLLLVRASRGREVLADRLTAAGAEVYQVVVYSSTDVDTPVPEIQAALAAGRIDWVTVTSSAIARSLAALFGDALHRTRLVSISPVTTATLQELGHQPTAEATEYTMEGVVQAVVRGERRERD